MPVISIDRSKSLREESNTGHNRWRPDIPPAIEVDEGVAVTLETGDACDGQLRPGATEAALATADAGVIHPLTGPVAIKGAEPGDLLEVEFISIEPQPYAFSAIVPGPGFLRDAFTEPFLAHWNIAVGYATSPQISGVRVPGASFMGVSGVAPSLRQLAEWTRREAALVERGGLAFPPDASGAAPATGAEAVAGVRTLPPRENGGNFDVKQLSAGANLLLPVAVAGALFATGDGHFVQGDGEVCVTAVEMGATGTARFRLWKGKRGGITSAGRGSGGRTTILRRNGRCPGGSSPRWGCRLRRRGKPGRGSQPGAPERPAQYD